MTYTLSKQAPLFQDGLNIKCPNAILMERDTGINGVQIVSRLERPKIYILDSSDG